MAEFVLVVGVLLVAAALVAWFLESVSEWDDNDDTWGDGA